MELEKLIAYYLSKPYARNDYPFGPESTVIKVASKMFALISTIDISLKCDPFVARSLGEQYPLVTPDNLLNEDNWNTIKVDGSIPGYEVYWMITHSYELVLKSLTKAERDGLTISAV